MRQRGMFYSDICGGRVWLLASVPRQQGSERRSHRIICRWSAERSPSLEKVLEFAYSRLNSA